MEQIDAAEFTRQQQKIDQRIQQLQALRNRLDNPPQIDQARSDLDVILANEHRELRHSQRRQQEQLVSSFDEAWPDGQHMPPAVATIYTDTKSSLADLQLQEDEDDDNPLGI